jgi:uncharacterized membrane protein YccC
MMGIDKGKTIRTLRLSLTCIFLFLISWYYEIPESSWSLVTIWFVMYEYSTVGGVLNKSMLRFIGTSLSALYGIIIIYCCGNNPVINILAVIPGLFMYSYFFMGNDKVYTATIGAVTLTIVLLNYNKVDVAILRVFNVLIGICASVFMIRFFYPQYARNLIIEAQIVWFDEFMVLIKEYMDPTQELATIKKSCTDLEHAFLSNLTMYNRLVNEAKMETKSAPFFIRNSVVIKEQVQLLFHLFASFVSFLSSNETRTHPWIINQLTALLNTINQIKNKLICREEDLIPNPQSLVHQEEEIELFLEYKPSIEKLFQEMNQLVAIIGKEIEQSVLIYEHYDCAIQTI